jgi:solute:Na+ symporter, SSS family
MTIAITILYLIIIILPGYLGYRKTHTTADYLLAGRNVNPLVMAISYVTTFFSIYAIVGFAGMSAIWGMSFLWLSFMNISVGIFIAFLFFGKRIRRMGYLLKAHTLPEFLGKRYNSSFIQKFTGGVIFLIMPLISSMVLMSAARFIESQYNIGYGTALLLFTFIITAYVFLGGMKGTMYSDALQGILLFLGLIILVVVSYYNFGGVTEAHRALGAIAIPPSMSNLGHRGFTSLPVIGSSAWWILVSSIIIGMGIGILAQPHLVVRFMTVKSNRELNRAMVVGGIFMVVMTAAPYLLGPLSNVYFTRNPDRLEFCSESGSMRKISPSRKLVTVNSKNIREIQEENPSALLGDRLYIKSPCTKTSKGSISINATVGTVSAIIPQYIKLSMPRWFSLMFMLTFLAAAMSTLSSQFHSMGTSIARDIYESIIIKEHHSGRSTRNITKAGIGVVIFTSALLAFYLPQFFNWGAAIIARGTAVFFALVAGTFLPAYIAALYWKRATARGAAAGIIGGFFTNTIWLLFFYENTSAVIGLSQFLIGRTSFLSGSWNVVDPFFITLPVSTILTIIFSLTNPPMDEAHLDHCFNKPG